MCCQAFLRLSFWHWKPHFPMIITPFVSAEFGSLHFGFFSNCSQFKGHKTKDASWPAFKGEPNERSKLALKCRNVNIFSIAGCCSIKHLYKTYFFVWNLSSSVHSHVHLLLNNKELKRTLFDTFTKHASLVFDVTNTDCWAQNGSAHSHVSLTYNCGLLANGMRNSIFFIFFILFPLVGPIMLMLLQFGSPLTIIIM